MRKSVDMKKGRSRCRAMQARQGRRGEDGLAKSAGERAANARGKSRRQALSVLQHETLVGRIAEKLFHGAAHINLLSFRQLAAWPCSAWVPRPQFFSGKKGTKVGELAPFLSPVDRGRG
ncbi:hypothetical protein, partial [Mesorhizobium sp.]|uniref:hypothetical protein n=1 Tax=Mesorhizobium sp. TaxID=1871066 RepID=UPI0025BFAA67